MPQTLAGDLGALKERTIAVDVFGRQPRSDLAEDTIVRVSAREVRKRLAQYYVSPEGVAAEIRIDLLHAPYFYAMFEQALRINAGEPSDTHRRRIGALWSQFSAVAALAV